MRQDQWERVGNGRADVQEVDLEPVERRAELRQRVQPCLGSAPVVLLGPVSAQVLQVGERDALRPVCDGLPFWPSGSGEARLEVVQVSLGDRDRYRPIVDSLRYDDPYMVCADFDAYLACEARAAAAYTDPTTWSRMALQNIIGGSRFSSDATIRLYAKEIWGLESVRTNLALLEQPL